MQTYLDFFVRKLIMTKQYKGFGPTIIRVAATNEPHIRLKDNPITVVERDGEKLVRIPLLFKGEFSHPSGTLVFDNAFFDTVIKNHNNEVWDAAPYFRKGHTRSEALAWFDASSGGCIVAEGNLLVGYVKPVDDEALKNFETGRYRYASIDLHTDYQSNVLKELETTDSAGIITIEGASDDEAVELQENVNKMEITQEMFEELSNKVAGLVTSLELATAVNSELGAKIVELEESTKAPVVEAKEEIIVAEAAVDPRIAELEAANVKLQEVIRNQRVDHVIYSLEQFRTKGGKGYTSALINDVRAILSQKPFGDEEIKLENGNTEEYYHKAIAHIVLNHINPEVTLEGVTTSTNEETVLESADTVDARLKGYDFAKVWTRVSDNAVIGGI